MQDVQTTLTPTLADAHRVPPAARPLVRLGLLLAVVAAGYGYSLRSGLWLDDHLHYQQLQKAGWNYRDLVAASTLDAGVKRVRFWGSLEHELRFYRPVSFGLMKAEYTLVGWQPAAMHAFNLAWHVAVAYLVGSLAAGLLRDSTAGTIASLLFAAFPNHVPTVYWIACQTELMVTFFVLTATLAYGRWAGWFAPVAYPARTGQRLWLAISLVCFAAALGCRENAVVLPAILVAGDLFLGGWSVIKRRVPLYLVLAGMVGLYAVVRTEALSGWALPHRPYLVYWSDPEFPAFASRKVLYYLGGLLLYLPVLPGAAADYFAEKTHLLWVGAAWSVVVVTAALLLWRRWVLLLGAVWMILVFGAILPVEPSPHHLYLAGVGSTLLLTAVVRGGWRAMTSRCDPSSRFVRWSPGLAGGTSLVLLTAACLAVGALYVFGTAAEDQLVSDVLTKGDPLESGDELFFINQPMIAGWPGAAIETASRGRLHDLKSYTLTLADEVVVMTRPSTVTPLDRYHLRLRTDPPGWMDGAAGQVFAELSGARWPFEPGQVVPGPVFDVTIEGVDPAVGGITSLLLRFHEPVDKPGRHFYFGSRYQVAYPLHFRFDRPVAVTGSAAAGEGISR